MKDIFLRKEILKRPGPLKKHYDVVIVGGGSHGLATAYYLAIHHGITNVAILEKSYIGSGAAGRNTTIIRANYRTPEGAAFYKESVKLYEKLSADLDTMSLDLFRVYAEVCGWTLARGHARSGDPIAIDAYLGGGDRFDRAIARFAAAYAAQNQRDFEAVSDALAVATRG